METEQYMYLLYQQLNVGNEKLASDVYKKAVGRAVDAKLLYSYSKAASTETRPRVARMCEHSTRLILSAHVPRLPDRIHAGGEG